MDLVSEAQHGQHTRWYHCELTKLFSTTINVISLSIIV